MLNILRALELSNVVWDDKDRICDTCLAKVSWNMSSTYSTTLKCARCELDFSRDMMAQSQRLVNQDLARNNKYNVSVRNNLQENKKRLEWEHHIGDKVSLECEHKKLDKPYLGPFDTLNVFENSTAMIQK